MAIISREEAICLFYAVPYNQENVIKYTKMIEVMEDVEICFTRNPKKPRLLCTRVIYANRFDIHLHKSSKETIENNKETDKEVDKVVNTENKLEIASTHQLKQFINTTYLSTDPKSEAYEHRYLSINNIISEV
ncbi:hypothetical protein BCV72DRAFT_326772 [Rhizopus microsporus var. microsporus]|uniref:Uncharacterized protein n=2 Tax=Rhizopus microsporus TaxID=58291 RepID=A0A2G4SF88_RHIZD|nr:uncharacterized protein RHIMIDRAFT_295915 [Rhizopus microsporus ATCC 52813]ORE07340.1 hypothetical protein BCV72DRAFT_326772 [Rhizopus microsporus var. microsporus]PHZ07439.1 hypothetical protein RHIMIDRAFT_295915 [Rhizopus microsporus ATCC 52813]